MIGQAVQCGQIGVAKETKLETLLAQNTGGAKDWQ